MASALTYGAGAARLAISGAALTTAALAADAQAKNFVGTEVPER